jgi:Ni/Fe-hydrogenase 1 B-type cytochrome subunit
MASKAPVEGHEFTEGDSAQGVAQTAVYVYEVPVRLWHWVNALCIVALCVTGYFIGKPPFTLSGEASSHSFMGQIREIHFIAGQIMTVAFIGRIYWAYFGNTHARQIFHIPFWSKAWWGEVWHEIKWYALIAPQPKRYIGHNPLAHLAMFFLFTCLAVGMLLTGWALYAEAKGIDSVLYMLFGWVIDLFGGSFPVHTIHRLGMWVIIGFTMIHLYAAIREDIMSKQTIISSMFSGWRHFRD